MSTENYLRMLKQITQKIIDNDFKYKNNIIMGDNSSGKSEILKMILEKKDYQYCFIDSVNRTFNDSKVSITKEIFLKKGYRNITEYRLEEDNFNLKDTFNLYGDGSGKIEDIYFNFEKQLKDLLYKFLGIRLEIKDDKNELGDIEYTVCIDEVQDKLSSGYQAIIRMFLEIIYFNEECKSNNAVVVIDEINEFLSAKNEEKILPFLMREFPNLNFIITTHSADVIASAQDCNIIVLKKHNYECLDGNDFNSVTNVREIFEDLYNIDNSDVKKQDIDMTLRRLLNLKIINKWTDIEEEDLKNVSNNKLSNTQMLLLNQIRSW